MVTLAFSVSSNMMFQSIGKSLEATILSLFRSGLCFIPILMVLSHIIGLQGVQLAQPLSDLVTFFLTIPFIVRFLSRLPVDDAVKPLDRKK
jgi:Na+-driven multidrug efflux pump